MNRCPVGSASPCFLGQIVVGGSVDDKPLRAVSAETRTRNSAMISATASVYSNYSKDRHQPLAHTPDVAPPSAGESRANVTLDLRYDSVLGSCMTAGVIKAPH